MKNVKSVITSYNNKILSTATKPPSPTSWTCNCRNPICCPLEGKCSIKSIVYKADITDEYTGRKKCYVGITVTTFKERFRNHKKSFVNPSYANDTELSKHVGSLKNRKSQCKVKWAILKHLPPLKSGRKQCNLCNNGKLFNLQTHYSTGEASCFQAACTKRSFWRESTVCAESASAAACATKSQRKL